MRQNIDSVASVEWWWYVRLLVRGGSWKTLRYSLSNIRREAGHAVMDFQLGRSGSMRMKSNPASRLRAADALQIHSYRLSTILSLHILWQVQKQIHISIMLEQAFWQSIDRLSCWTVEKWLGVRRARNRAYSCDHKYHSRDVWVADIPVLCHHLCDTSPRYSYPVPCGEEVWRWRASRV
jgi:hypothetical protein